MEQYYKKYQLLFCQMSDYLIKLYMHMYPMYCRKEEVSSCQKQLQEFKAAAGVLMKWPEETKEQVPVLQPNCSEQGLGTDLQKVNVSDGFNFSPLIVGPQNISLCMADSSVRGTLNYLKSACQFLSTHLPHALVWILVMECELI